MCRLKSAIILQDRVYIPNHDSHSDMLDELGIEDTRQNAEKLFVRAELAPKNNDIFEPVDNWTYIVDQDILPDWYVDEYDKQRMISAVKEWVKKYIHQGIDNLTIQDGGTHYCKDCINIRLYGNSTAYLSDNSTAKLYGNSTAIIIVTGATKLDNCIISDNATLKDCRTKTIYQSGDWQYETIDNGGD